MTPQEYCHRIVTKSGSSFYYSFFFLATEQRQAIEAVYSFARVIDDVVDTQEPELAARQLQWWATELTSLANYQATHPITQALQHSRQHFTIPLRYLQDLLDGMFLDLEHRGFHTFSDLKPYCYHVAGTIGLLTASILGSDATAYESYAKNLGIALQLVNIIRDIGEDIQRDRLYLPESDLVEFGITQADLKAQRYSPAFRALMARQAERAKHYYQTALQNLEPQHWLEQRCGLVMAAIYFALLEEIEKSDFQTLHQKICLTPIRKLWIAWRTTRTLERKKHSITSLS